jgi:hypothetical protein
MMRFCWLRGGRPARGTPPIRRTLRRHPILLPILTLVILSQSGCQSGFFGPCGPCANGPFRRFRERIFNRDGCGGGACGGGTVISDVPGVEGGAPAVIAPAPVLTPGTTLPAPTEVSPQLESIPSATPGPASGSGSGSGSSSSGGTQGARAPTGKANYEAARPGYRLGRFRPGTFPRTYAQRTPVPTSRSARGSVPVPGPVGPSTRLAEAKATELSLLDNLPPLDLPRDEGRIATRTASTPTGDLDAKPTAAPAPDETSRTEVDAAGVAVPDEAGAASGPRRFAVVEPKLAGGSLPTSAGLDWLAERGYKTLVDLREPSEVQSSFLAEVSKKGMRYISLPMSLSSVDSEHIARFHFEISLADARPLYFFDTEGNRAGMLWYIQRMTVKNDSYDPEEATRQAEEMGLADPAFREAARRYLEDAKPKTTAAAPTMPTTTPAATPATVPSATSTSTAPPASTTPVASAKASEAALPEPAPVQGPTPELPDESKIPARPEALALPAAVTSQIAQVTSALKEKAASAQDPTAWRPLAALLLTVLGIPAAYWSRSALSFRGRTRASLPGPARRLRSLPTASGE